jgi:HipA-like protein
MRKILKKIVGDLWKTAGQEGFKTPKNVEADFKLVFKELVIGHLFLKDGQWTFYYTEEFKSQNEVKPLPDFPDVEKSYLSDELYPFFIQRIPGSGQPKVKELIKKEKIDGNNLVDLLKRFGKFSITNPFELIISR